MGDPLLMVQGHIPHPVGECNKRILMKSSCCGQYTLESLDATVRSEEFRTCASENVPLPLHTADTILSVGLCYVGLTVLVLWEPLVENKI